MNVEEYVELRDQLSHDFVLKTECDSNRAKTQEEIAGMKTDIAIVKSRLSIIIGILVAIATPTLTIAVKLLFNAN